MKRHLVVGGTGRIGALLVDILIGKALRVRATTHRKWMVNDRGPVSWAYLDLATGEGIEQAFAGIDRAFLSVPASLPDAQEIMVPLIVEAKRRRLEKVVLMTPLGRDGRPAVRCEAALRRTGLRCDIIRPDADLDPRMIAASAARFLTREDLGDRVLEVARHRAAARACI